MKLLFDQNLSPKLVKSLEDIFPDSNHVSPLNLDEANDTKIWEFAKANHFTLVTKDADFSDINILHGFRQRLFGFDEEIARPPK